MLASAIVLSSLGLESASVYLIHYHGERNHQGLGNTLIDPAEEVRQTDGQIECREHLGGMLKYYYRQAA